MKTGKVEYAPDYKSTDYKSKPKIKRAFPDVKGKFQAMEIRAEHQRLQSAVVAAAVAELRMERAANEGSNTITRTRALIEMRRAMRAKCEAVDALIAFEAEHGIGEK